MFNALNILRQDSWLALRGQHSDYDVEFHGELPEKLAAGCPWLFGIDDRAGLAGHNWWRR
jgi:hypothetical protein